MQGICSHQRALDKSRQITKSVVTIGPQGGHHQIRVFVRDPERVHVHHFPKTNYKTTEWDMALCSSAKFEHGTGPAANPAQCMSANTQSKQLFKPQG